MFDAENCYGIYVPEDIKIIQEQQITKADLKSAVKLMKNNRTPGDDGIPVDFYKVFWLQLEEAFNEMMIAAYNTKKLCASTRRGILNLIPKSGKDARHVKNLRPITLLNTDYKIIEKAIARKMELALKHIIHRDQRGFMKNRRISGEHKENVRHYT